LVAPSNFQFEVFSLIDLTQQEGWTDQFVSQVQKNRPNNTKVKALVSELQLLEIEPGDRLRLVDSSLERTVKERAGIDNFVEWADRLFSLRRKICRIEDPTVPGKALGTGFLVASDLVLTNYHVVSDYISGKSAAQLGCRFDYVKDATGEQPGTVQPVASGQKWLVDYSPFSQVDPGDQGGLPQPNELDYALLRLFTAVGDEDIPGVGKRSWISVSTASALPEPTDIIFIVQHPKGEPLKLAVGTVIKRNENSSRVRYDTNTNSGSSGSPCFDAKLNLVALHHGGDPDTGQLAKFNQGIPIETILTYLQSRPAVPHFWQ
jgi:V8-like Glu-specific endopeptidase